MIDVHTHAVPGPDAAAPIDPRIYTIEPIDEDLWQVAVDGAPVRVVDATAFDVEARIRRMDVEGVRRQLVSPTPFLFRYTTDVSAARALGRATNRAIAEMVSAAPDRFHGIGTVTLQDTAAAVGDLYDAIDRGLIGVEVGTHLPDRELHNPALDRFWEAANDTGALVFVHPWTSRLTGVSLAAEQFAVGYPAATATAFTALVAGQLTRRFPRIRWLLAHGGGCATTIVGRLDQAGRHLGHPYVGDDRPSPLQILRDCYVDGLVYLPEQLAALVAVMGTERVCVGTDFPFAAREQPPGAALENAVVQGFLDRGAAEQIRVANATRLLDPMAGV